MKREITSLFVVLAVAFCSVVTASAAGYGESPGYRPSGGNGGSSIAGTREVPGETAGSAVAAGQAININKSGGAVSLETLQKIIAENVDKDNVNIKFVSDKKGNEYILEIPLDSINSPRTLNVLMDIIKSDKITMHVGSEKIQVPEGSLRIVPTMKGDFGMDFNLTFPESHFKDLGDDINGMKLIYVNAKTLETKEIFEFIPFNEDGSITVTINKASYYYLLPVAQPLAIEDEVTEDKEEASEENEPINDNDTDPDQNAIDIDDTDIIYSDDDGELSDDDEEEDSSPWWNSDGGELNPPTGVVIGGTAIAGLSAAIAIISKKRRRR
ncbi:MAG: hypothetical protein LBR74_06375 [Eubacterium sp.]|jgi:hypothetical protein|nr:hypothetical protein [Eubacterium sp.]